MARFQLKANEMGLGSGSMKFNAGCGIRYRGGLTSNNGDISRYVTAIRSSLIDGLQDIVSAISANLDKALSSNIFSEPGGDIISSGKLLRSRDITLNSSGDIIISYDVPYANLVHYGGYINVYGSGNKVYIPGRPFIEAALTNGYGLTPPDYYQIILDQLNR